MSKQASKTELKGFGAVDDTGKLWDIDIHTDHNAITRGERRIDESDLKYDDKQALIKQLKTVPVTIIIETAKDEVKVKVKKPAAEKKPEPKKVKAFKAKPSQKKVTKPAKKVTKPAKKVVKAKK